MAVHQSAKTRESLDRIRAALPYLCALPPMLYYGGLWVLVAVVRHPELLWRTLADVALGVAALALLRWRRRFPWQIAVATVAMTLVSWTAFGPAYVAYVSMGRHQPLRRFAWVAAVSWLRLATEPITHGFTQQSLIGLVTDTAVYVGLTSIALYLRTREELARSQRAAAEAAAREQQHRIEQARLAERAKIAQEMHDVLAHRISLLSMLAGGLAYRTDLSPEEMRATAQAIQENAHQSLTELRSVLRTLRTNGTDPQDGAVAAPQPTLADLETLFDEVRAAGQKVDVHDNVTGRESLPAGGDDLIGQFSQNTYLATTIDLQTTLTDAIAIVRAGVYEAMRNQASFWEIARAANPDFDAMRPWPFFHLYHAWMHGAAFAVPQSAHRVTRMRPPPVEPDAALLWLWARRHAPGLTVDLDGGAAVMGGNPTMYPASLVREILQGYVAVLKALMDDPEQRIADLKLP